MLRDAPRGPATPRESIWRQRLTKKFSSKKATFCVSTSSAPSNWRCVSSVRTGSGLASISFRRTIIRIGRRSRIARLLIWRPRGVLSEGLVNKILMFVGDQEGKLGRSFNRFTDMSALSAVDLSFRYVFHVALYRRLSRVGRETVKSAFLVRDPTLSRYVKLHALMTDHSPLEVAIFEKYEAAARCLGVPLELLMAPTPAKRTS
jgi:hypothetical protein